MLKHTLEEAIESVRQVKDDMISGKPKTKRKHRNFTSSFSSSTSSSISSSKEDIKPWKDK
jgi:hypothetical protein